jgi:hypothetical protein
LKVKLGQNAPRDREAVFAQPSSPRAMTIEFEPPPPKRGDQATAQPLNARQLPGTIAQLKNMA